MPQPHALDYRQQYGGAESGVPAHAGAPGYPANPYHQGMRNPLTTGQWVMIGAAALAVGGFAYWGYVTWQEKKKNEANNQQQNPVRHITMGAQTQQAPYPRAA